MSGDISSSDVTELYLDLKACMFKSALRKLKECFLIYEETHHQASILWNIHMKHK